MPIRPILIGDCEGSRLLKHRSYLAATLLALLTLAMIYRHDERTPAPISEPGDDGVNLEQLQGGGASFAEQVVELVNIERMNVGRNPLKGVAILHGTSLDHSTNTGGPQLFRPL